MSNRLLVINRAQGGDELNKKFPAGEQNLRRKGSMAFNEQVVEKKRTGEMK